jgi:hypothetical protein
MLALQPQMFTRALKLHNGKDFKMERFAPANMVHSLTVNSTPIIIPNTASTSPFPSAAAPIHKNTWSSGPSIGGKAGIGIGAVALVMWRS